MNPSARTGNTVLIHIASLHLCKDEDGLAAAMSKQLSRVHLLCFHETFEIQALQLHIILGILLAIGTKRDPYIWRRLLLVVSGFGYFYSKLAGQRLVRTDYASDYDSLFIIAKAGFDVSRGIEYWARVSKHVDQEQEQRATKV